jgi:hypothetical protein
LPSSAVRKKPTRSLTEKVIKINEKLSAKGKQLEEDQWGRIRRHSAHFRWARAT